jgi:hypothetical protein
MLKQKWYPNSRTVPLKRGCKVTFILLVADPKSYGCFFQIGIIMSISTFQYPSSRISLRSVLRRIEPEVIYSDRIIIMP